jgi:hypothetical protein
MVSWCDEIGSRAHYITNSLALSGGTVLFCPADEVRASRGLHHRALRLRSTYTRSAHYSPEDFREREFTYRPLLQHHPLSCPISVARCH